ncbi:MAG: NYN domain-containing protein [Methanoregula sp.]|jgi:uncharacterized LabA/DUF88 family protein|uniref:LabA-like NYN domain-containing protein n=1 Tax=Methanoregula sp. TaxID=2052170 RepID=UPI0025EF9603|nr:NYN domain-containing protein [Methanoregula sp.]MCK9632173.1 NYN domain-containing protein [Methanoregula sp.]
MKRVCVFIDGSNFYHGIKHHIGKTNIDFNKLSLTLCNSERELVRTYYYNAPVNQEDNEAIYKSQQRFFNELKKLPDLQLRLGRLEHKSGGVKEKGVDIYLAVDMLRYAYNNIYDVAILISSDGDFSEAVNALKDLGKHVEYAHFATGISKHLMDCCDKNILLNEDLLKPCFTH